MDRLRSWLGLTPGNVFAPYLVGSLSIAVLVALSVPAALLAGLPPAYAWTLGLTLLAVALVFVVVFAVSARQEAHRVSGLLNGEIWGRWSYPAADEERLAAEEWARTRSMARQTLGSALLVVAIVGGTLALSGLGVALSAAAAGVLGAILLLIGLVVYLRGRGRYERRRSETREVVFGPIALLQNGTYVPLWGTKTRLQGVAVEPAGTEGATDPHAGQALRFERLIERRSSTTTSSDWWWLNLFSHRYWAKSTTSVPVPTGLAAEAEALAERYRHRYGLASSEAAPRGGTNGTRIGLAARSS